jgi:PRTRC genetic system protein E
MNFFQQLDALDLQGDLNLVVSKQNGKLVVSALLKNEKCGDKAAKLIAPMVISGSAADLDEGFIDAISAPLQEVSGLMVNMEAHLKSVAAAKQQSTMAKDGKSAAALPAPKPTVDPQKVAYDKAMAAVKELVDKKKYTDAIKKLPDPKTYDKKKSIIDDRKTWLMQMAMDGGGMFPQPYPEDPEEIAPEPVVAPDPVEPSTEQASGTDQDEENEEEESETDNEE